MFFLLDPVDTSDVKTVPGMVEVIGNDTTNGVFSFYAREEKSAQDSTIVWKFYGTSADFVTNDYDCDVSKFSGACQAKLAQDNGVAGNASGVRCASCHPGGGLVQKELNSPWTNWQQNPGNYVQANAAVLGSFQNGDSFEGVTTPMNAAWAKKRIKVLTDPKLVPAARQVKELLRPVFCTMDINLQSGGTFGVRADLLLDAMFVNPGGFFGNPDAFGGIGSTQIIPGNLANYAQVIKANQQAVPSSTNGDTGDAFMYPERSNLDNQYVAALKDLVGEDLLRDILFVDFTRPIFSPTRCSLVDLPDGLTNPQTARADLLAKLQQSASSDAEKEFLASLSAQGSGAARHSAEIDAYKAACAKRSGDPKLTEDVVRYASHLRRVARLPRVDLVVEKSKDNPDGDFGIIDFDETLPKDQFDSQPLDQPFFSKTDCTLQVQ
jgi:hypothetical protein